MPRRPLPPITTQIPGSLKHAAGVLAAAAFGVVVFGVCGAPTAEAATRVPNTSLTLPLQPPQFGYMTEAAFGPVRFTDPVVITTSPGETERLFVAEQNGVVAVITNLAAPNRTVFLDISARVSGGQPTDERGLLGLAFHPGYATNGQFFVYYSTSQPGSLHQRVSRFHVSQEDPNRAAPDSEQVLISQEDEAGNHNGGDLQFGPDGYLYIAVGDEGGGNDSWNNSQLIDKDFHAGILRIDVDLRPGNLAPNSHPAVSPGAYAVPADNPWVGATEFNGRPVNPADVRTEFWAVGLRNPWRMSFDPETGELWAGDVGQGRWEEIDVIVRGGNYGWAFREGTQNGPKAGEAPSGFVQIPPVAQYGHGSGPNQGNSVTGGLVYRGERLSQLTGSYVFADYVSGNLWAVRRTGTNTSPMQRLTGRGGIAGFGRDPRNGDVLLADQNSDAIMRLSYSGVSTGDPLPPTLADTGAFQDLLTLEPQPGIEPYEINVPFWSDGALKQRWFSIPDTNQFVTFHATEPWQFPVGSVWVKHFDIDLTNGIPESRRRLETRFIVRNEAGVYGITYRWEGTNAVLVPEEGMDETLVIHDGETERTQVWRYPSRAECLRCHTPAAGWVLGFKTSQLNRWVETTEGATHQLAHLAGAGYFANPPASHYSLPALAPATNETASVEWRVRSWMDSNCSQCHQPGGSALGAWDARASTPLSQTGLIDGRLSDDEGDPAHRIVAPGSVDHTMIHSRITRLGEGRMPPIASRVVDEAAAALLRQWITNDLPAWQSYAAWQVTHFQGTNDPIAAVDADPDLDGAANWLEYLTATDPRDAAELWKPVVQREDDAIVLRYSRLANRGFVVEWTDRLGVDAVWQSLETPENSFLIAAESQPVEVPHPVAGDARFLRVRVFEP